MQTRTIVKCDAGAPQAIVAPAVHFTNHQDAHIQCCCPVCAAVRRGDLAAHWNPLSSRLDGFDSRALRSILGIHWRDHVSNETVRILAGQLPASSLAARCWVRWYGRVLRLPPHHSSRAILDFDPGSFGWKRPRGAPRTRWLDVVKRDLDQLAIEPLAQVRGKWRALVNMVGSTHNATTGAVHETR